MSNHLVLGSRGSALALKQVEIVRESLSSQLGLMATELKVIQTTGDLRTDVPLAQVAKVSGVVDKGVFIKEIEQALADGFIDCAVHSLKDVPSVLDERFEIAVVLPRAAAVDILVLRQGVNIHEACIGTSSLRRQMMARAMWGDGVRFADIRGNVPTRLQKLAQSTELGGIILAKAGLERLGYFSQSLTVAGVCLEMLELDMDFFMPAVGQGVIALEVRKGDEATKALLKGIHHEETSLCIRAERHYLAALGADCSTPVGVHARIVSAVMTLDVLNFQDADSPRRLHAVGNPLEPEALAQSLL